MQTKGNPCELGYGALLDVICWAGKRDWFLSWYKLVQFQGFRKFAAVISALETGHG